MFRGITVLARLLMCASLVIPLSASAVDGEELPVIEFAGRQEISALQVSSLTIKAFSSRPGVPRLRMDAAPEETEFLDNGDGTRTFQSSPEASEVGEYTVTFEAADARAQAVDVDGTTVVIGSTLYEMEGNRVMAEHDVGGEIDLYYVTSIDLSHDTVAMAARERPQDGVWLYNRVDGAWQFDQHLVADPERFPEGMGTVVALDGDTLAIAAVYDSGMSVNGAAASYKPGAGAVVMYERADGVWAYSSTLRASNPEANDYFGSSLALDGDTLVVGAIGEDSSATGVDSDQSNNAYQDEESDLNSAGAAYVFERTDSGWVQSAYLKPSSNILPHIGFGHAVAVSADTIAVSAPYAPRAGEEVQALAAYPNDYDLDYFRTGNVFIFERQSSEWVETLRMSAPANNWRFGLDLDVRENQLLVLTQTHAYLHERSDDVWQLIWNRDVGAGVVAFNDEAMVFGVLNRSSSVFTKKLY